MQFSQITFSNVVNNPPVSSKKGNFCMQNPFELKKDVFERNSKINFKGTEPLKPLNNEKKAVVKELRSTSKYAKMELNKQIASDGWAGKTADWISGAWSSKNRAHLVNDDIEIYDKQVKELDLSLKTGKFEEKFKEIFGIEYNQKNIDDYNKKSEDFMLATTTKAVEKIVEDKLNTHINEFNKNGGVLKDKTQQIIKTNVASGTIIKYDSVKNKKEVLTEFENSLVQVMGKKEILEKSAKTQGVDLKTATDEEKYKVYGKIANYLLQTTELTAKKCSNGKPLKELKKEYEDSYYKAYGDKNDIQDRVEKYNRSQRIGAEAVKGVAVAGVVAATVLTTGTAYPILVGAGATFGATLASECLDYTTNDIDGDLKENWRNVLKWATLDSATYALTYGLSEVIPIPKTTSKVAETVFNVGKDTAIDVALTAGNAYLDRGEVTKKELSLAALAAVTFSTLTYSFNALDFSKLVKDSKIKGLTKEKINSTIKSRLLKEQAVETINNVAWESASYASTQVGIEKTPLKEYLIEAKEKIKKNYEEKPEVYESLYHLSMNSPEKFDNIVLDVLANKIKEECEKIEK